jgi:hypothetical protein
MVPGVTKDEVCDRTHAILNTVSVRGGQVTVDPDVIASNTPEVSVTVAVPLDQNGWLAPLFLGDHTMTGSLTLVREETVGVTVP